MCQALCNPSLSIVRPLSRPEPCRGSRTALFNVVFKLSYFGIGVSKEEESERCRRSHFLGGLARLRDQDDGIIGKWYEAVACRV